MRKAKRPAQTRNPAYQSMIGLLVKIREEANITQTELAQKMGFAQTDISKIERCERRLDLIEAIEILNLLTGNDQKKVSTYLTKISALYKKTKPSAITKNKSKSN